MANFSILEIDDIQDLIQRYGMEVISYDSINGGACNSSYKVITSKGAYVLTVFEEQDHKYLERFCEILIHLNKNKFVTSEAIELKGGGYVTSIFGKPVILKTYLIGDVQQKLDQNMLFQIGEEMAKLHELPPAKFVSSKHPHGIEKFPKNLGYGGDVDFEEWLKSQIDYISMNINDELPKSLIHGDLFHDNILFLNSGLIAFIDFVESCNYYKIFDLGMAVVGLCIDNSELDFNKVKALLEGYETIRELTVLEKKSFQFHIVYAATTIASWRYRRYHIEKEVFIRRNNHKETVEIAERIRKISEGEFNMEVFD